MTTLPIRAPYLLQINVPGFARFVAAVSIVIDAYAEALQQTREAQRKYPFASV